MGTQTGRLFTFGCSFTQYAWPTWADILGREFDYFENWGRAGGSNGFILKSLVECNARNTITKSDTIIIMWSGIGREEQYKNHKWKLTGNRVKHKKYDNRGYLLSSLSDITAAKLILDSIGCTYHFLAMTLLTDLNAKPTCNAFEVLHDDNVADILQLYADTIEKIKPCMADFCNILSNPRPKIGLLKPTKASMLRIILTQIEETNIKKYNKCKGSDWPDSYYGVYSGKDTGIIDEISEFQRSQEYRKNEIIAGLKNTKLAKTDLHPMPIEHLDYISTILPEYTIGQPSRDWVKKCNDIVITHGQYFWYYTKLNRHLPNSCL